MRKLLFEELTILSKTEKKARRIAFSPSKTVIIGENDVGKSTLMKSLYNVLGADTPLLNNSRWRKANPIYCLRFSVGKNTYHILRDEKYFGLFDDRKRFLGRYEGITREGGVAAPVNRLLGFDIELESADGRMRPVGPAYYFLPFYVDQDEGWSKSWSSFSGLQGVKNYRKNMIEYHLGIRPQSFYDAKKKSHELDKRAEELSAEKTSLTTISQSYQTRKAAEIVDIDPEEFKAEIEELVRAYNETYEKQQNLLSLIKDARNRRLSLEGEIDVLNHSIRELDADYQFAERPSTPDVVDCPTCGTGFENSIVERFGILDDIDYCRNLIDQKRKQIIGVDNEISDLDKQYAEFSNELSSVDTLLKRKRDDVTLADVIRSEGYKDILRSISADIKAIDDQQDTIHREIATLKPDLTVDRDLKKAITAFYQAKMKESVNKVNVHVLTEADYKTLEKAIKTNAIGSDLPRSLLAQYMTFLHTMNRYNSFTVCPFVIDSPLQQEQDKENSGAIFDFIFSGLLEEQQLVLGTLPSDDVRKRAEKDEGTTIIELDVKYGVLTADAYEGCLAALAPMHEATLSVPYA